MAILTTLSQFANNLKKPKDRLDRNFRGPLSPIHLNPKPERHADKRFCWERSPGKNLHGLGNVVASSAKRSFDASDTVVRLRGVAIPRRWFAHSFCSSCRSSPSHKSKSARTERSRPGARHSAAKRAFAGEHRSGIATTLDGHWRGNNPPEGEILASCQSPHLFLGFVGECARPLARVIWSISRVTIKGNARHDIMGNLLVRPLNDVLVLVNSHH